jgi:hypothetical protein
VAIGTPLPTPANELELSSASPAISLTNTAAGYGSLYFYEGTTLNGVVQGLSRTFGTASRQGALEIQALSPSGAVTLWSGSPAQERIRLDAAGTVLMDLSAPDAGTALRVFSDSPGPNAIARFENTAATAAQNSTGISVSDNGGARTLELDLAGSATTMPVFSGHIGYAILNTNGTPGLDLTTTNGNGVIRFFPAGLATERMRLTNTGILGIGTVNPSATSRLDLGGGCMTGSICSDSRLKANIRPLRESVMSRVMQLEPSTFQWKGRAEQKKTIGVIAQQVETVFPEVVTTTPDSGGKGIECTGLTAIAIKALQEQQVQLRQQQEQINALQKKLDALSKSRR